MQHSAPMKERPVAHDCGDRNSDRCSEVIDPVMRYSDELMYDDAFLDSAFFVFFSVWTSICISLILCL